MRDGGLSTGTGSRATTGWPRHPRASRWWPRPASALPAQRRRAHVGPQLTDPIEALPAVGGITDRGPARREFPTSGPDAVLLLGIDHDPEPVVSVVRLRPAGHDTALADVAALLRTGEVCATELVADCLARIESNRGLNAVVEPDAENALRAAHAADRLLRTGPAAAEPLCGLPVTVKRTFTVRGHPHLEPDVPAGEPFGRPATRAVGLYKASTFGNGTGFTSRQTYDFCPVHDRGASNVAA